MMSNDSTIKQRKRDRLEERGNESGKSHYLALDVEGDEDLKEGYIVTFIILLVVTGNHTFQPDTHTNNFFSIILTKK